MFPVAGVTYDLVQWCALEDCRPLGKPQLCRGQSARSCALNFYGSCGLRLYNLNYGGKKNPNTQTVCPLSSSQKQGRECSGVWRWWVSHTLPTAASCPAGHFPSLCDGGARLLTSLLVIRLLQVPFMVCVSAALANSSVGLGNAADSAW